MTSSDAHARRRAIACVYCGGEHESADDVKACWVRSAGRELAGAADEAPVTVPFANSDVDIFIVGKILVALQCEQVPDQNKKSQT